MTSIAVRMLSREQFVRWMSLALSGAPLPPGEGLSVNSKSAEVVLAWPEGVRDARPVVSVAQGNFRDFFAFVSTYLANVQPYTAYFRVVPLELLENLEHQRPEFPKALDLAKLIAGASIAESWLSAARNGERPGSALPLVRSTVSSALGQTVLAGYDPPALEWVLKEWLAIRRLDTADLVTDAAGNAWHHVHAAVSGSERAGSSRLHVGIVQFLSAALDAGTVNSEVLRYVSGGVAAGFDLRSVLTASREERVGRFNALLAELKHRSRPDVEAEFLAGLMLAIVGNGSFEMLRSAREFQGWLDGAATWFGICAALFEESNLLSYANSVGRRMVRDLLRTPETFGVITADIASTELRFIMSNKADVSGLAGGGGGSIDVELLPNVVSRLVLQEPGQDSQRAEEYEVMLMTLDEISRLTDRARKRLRRSSRDEQQPQENKTRRPSRFS